MKKQPAASSAPGSGGHVVGHGRALDLGRGRSSLFTFVVDTAPWPWALVRLTGITKFPRYVIGEVLAPDTDHHPGETIYVVLDTETRTLCMTSLDPQYAAGWMAHADTVS